MEIIDILKNTLGAFSSVSMAVLFGSFADGGQGSNSDVDLGIILHPDSLGERRRLEIDLGRSTGRAIDIIFLAQAPPLLRFEITQKGVLLVERQEHAWADFKAKAMVDWWDWAPTARFINERIISNLRNRQDHGST